MLLENSAVITRPKGDPCFVDIQCRAADYEAAYKALDDALPAWTQTPPALQGEYWHWNGDEDSAPLPMFVLWSGTSGKCFVSRGQLGIEHAIDCDEYGGWWLPLYAPPLPNDQAEPLPPDSDRGRH